MEWRHYRRVACPCCKRTWKTAPARLVEGRWWIDCPSCGEQPWRAVLSEADYGSCAAARLLSRSRSAIRAGTLPKGAQ